jgi:DNA-binding MarR family transcriptional regulator
MATMNIRYEILSAIAKEPYITLDELRSAIDYDPLKLLDSINACKKDGLLIRLRDEDSGQPAYTLTAKGKARHSEGPASQSALGRAKGIAKAKHTKESAIQTPDSEPTAEPFAELAAEVEASLDESDEDEYELPEPDAELLASANRMLSERLAGVASVLRGSGLPELANVRDGEDMQPHASALAGAYQMALSDLANANQLVDILKRNLATKENEIEHLASRLDDALYADNPALHTGGEVIGYYVLEGSLPDATTLVAALATATQVVRGGAAYCEVVEARRIGVVQRKAEWVPA